MQILVPCEESATLTLSNVRVKALRFLRDNKTHLNLLHCMNTGLFISSFFVIVTGTGTDWAEVWFWFRLLFDTKYITTETTYLLEIIHSSLWHFNVLKGFHDGKLSTRNKYHPTFFNGSIVNILLRFHKTKHNVIRNQLMKFYC